MPGNIVVKPVKADLTRDTSKIGKMNPYYVVSLGEHRQKGQVCKKGGKSPQWTDAVTIKKTTDPYCVVELKTKRSLLPDKTIGACKIGLDGLSEQKMAKWYDIIYKNNIAGRILIETNMIAGEANLIVRGQVRSLATQSVDAIDERNRKHAENARNAASLDSIPNKGEGYDIEGIDVKGPLGFNPKKFKHFASLSLVKEAEQEESEIKLKVDLVPKDIGADTSLDVPDERPEDEEINGKTGIGEAWD